MVEIFFPYDQKSNIFSHNDSKNGRCINAEVFDWLKENFGSECSAPKYVFNQTALWMYKIDYKKNGVQIAFKYEEDAILFKLTWGGL